MQAVRHGYYTNKEKINVWINETEKAKVSKERYKAMVSALVSAQPSGS
jgi:hypothetical protein